jgi:hypothetical protein
MPEKESREEDAKIIILQIQGIVNSDGMSFLRRLDILKECLEVNELNG